MRKQEVIREKNSTQDIGSGFGEVRRVVILNGVDRMGFHKKVRLSKDL